MIRIFILGVFILLFTACSEEAQPYKDVNTTLSASQEKGHIDTH